MKGLCGIIINKKCPEDGQVKIMVKLYVCGRCGYRSHHQMKCPSCGVKLEDECGKCYSAKGNCVCKFHGVFVGGMRAGNRKKSSAVAAARKKRRKKSKK